MGLFTLFRQYTAQRRSAAGNGSDNDARILMLGLDNSGKTSILQRLTTESGERDEATTKFVTEDVAPTQGFNVKSVRQDDSTDEVRMEESAMELTRLLREEKLATTPLIVLANKQDLFSALEVSEIIDVFELTSRINDDRAWTIQPCSAMTGEGIDEGMEWIMDQLIEQKAQSDGENQE